jgi:hypothetical protein
VKYGYKLDASVVKKFTKENLKLKTGEKEQISTFCNGMFGFLEQKLIFFYYLDYCANLKKPVS